MYYKFEIIQTIVDEQTQKPVRDEVISLFQGPDMDELMEDALTQLQMSAYYASAAEGYRPVIWMRRTVTP